MLGIKKLIIPIAIRLILAYIIIVDLFNDKYTNKRENNIFVATVTQVTILNFLNETESMYKNLLK